MNRIIAIGNRYAAEDSAGPRVFDLLARGEVAGTEIIDGGLAGLDLLRFIEGVDRVVFVDTVAGFGGRDEIVVLTPEMLASNAAGRHDHAAGLPFLLRALPVAIEGRIPEIRIVGVPGRPTEETLARAAGVALELATSVWGGDSGGAA